MTYLPIAAFGYCLNGLAILVDKFLVDKRIPNPFVYTFYLGILNILVLIFIPFGFTLPGQREIVFSFLSGLSFIIAWLTFYTALKSDEASRVAPFVGTINPVFTVTVGVVIFGYSLTASQFTAIAILILGLITLSYSSWHLHFKPKHLLFLTLAGSSFALSSVFLREVFLNTTFINGLVLSRIFIALIALLLLLLPETRKQIFKSTLTQHHFVNKTSFLLLLGQSSGALGGLLIIYAISLQNPALVNALAGVQYAFILMVVLILSHKYQKLLEEEFTKRVLVQKLAGVVIIGLGLIILAFSK